MRRALGTAAVAALAWVAVANGTSGASARHGGTAPLGSVADEAPGYAVEDFAYPGADKILAEQGITLKRGDGHIVLAECGPTGLLEVWARDRGEKVCFRATGNSGYLALEIPSVYAIRGNDYTTQVDMTVGTEEQSYDISQNAWTPVGESADEEGREFMLVEIRTSK
ncbi:hypothetical protein M2158_009039 [Streptomyces sp. SAI-144]|jgi:hypothetical protein|uniref:hypothetical protein n=1 Tax=unclassified Streptomyces TaxID=2593676 RepID=UPI0024753A9B|nr:MULTISPECIES: hypothetical protein [unclassified Streptomyces]MDH6440498.1 hypothetical protein [Streptomyces sp. SAI-144]MDH6487798.1 hypothetical protein [Streptomyces sp. SAI-127]